MQYILYVLGIPYVYSGGPSLTSLHDLTTNNATKWMNGLNMRKY